MKIDIVPIQAELQELSGEEQVRVRLDRKINVSCSIRQTDVKPQYVIRLNPTRIKSQRQLDSQLNTCRQVIAN